MPDLVLRFTSAEGPHPIVIHLSSRGKYRIPLYVFIPSTCGNLSSLPVLLDFHGGGFVFGSCQEQASFCAKMSRELNAISISVDYRLAPAAKFPAAIEDAEDVLNAILNPLKPGYDELRGGINQFLQQSSRSEVELDLSRIAVSGFSSGGNLALNLGLSIKTLQEIDRDWPSLFPSNFARDIPILLFYPSLDCRQLPNERPPPPGMVEKKGFADSFRLEADLMTTYLPRHHAGHPRASPGLATLLDGGLHQKAKILLVLPEFDTLAAQSDVWIGKVEKEDRIGDLTIERVKGVFQ